jgi:hypothetical protein
MHGPRIPFAVTLILFMLPQQVFAASKESKERAAKKACLKGDPEKGVGILTDLFVDTGELTYIFLARGDVSSRTFATRTPSDASASI